ncbi:protein FAR1-RELATED SEQUENCE 9-like [Phragmites australis]|nr:protein FAR1-RELATED SEQUENCE 9-like [Phragmites australis]
MKWQELLTTYNLENNSWLENLYALHEKWATVYRHDSFCADMTSTQRSEGMNNVFKKTFRRKLSISELLVEYDKCAARLRGNELYEDYKSRNSDPVLCISNLPLLKTAAESYTRNMYTIFEEEFKKQFVLSCTLQNSEGTTSTYKIMSMDRSEDEATVIFNSDDMQVLCSCKKYNCFGMLCKHVLKVFNHNDIITLPPGYISSRWTKYAKRGIFSCHKQCQSDNLSSQSALLSRKMISVALKCAVSKKVLQHLDDGFDKLTVEVENLLSQVNLNEKEAPQYFLECTKEVAEARISFKVPPHKGGPTLKRKKNVLEGGKKNAAKNTRKKEDPRQSSNKNLSGTSQQSELVQGPFNSNATATAAPLMINNMMPFGDNSMMFVPPIGGEFTNLLLQAQHEVPASRRLHFDE